MKVIDEKGRLFGKINIVDLLVIVLVAAVLVVLGVKFLGGKSTGSAGEEGVPTLTYTVRVMEVSQETYENVCQFVNKEAGLKDQLLASGKLLNGYVVDVTAAEHIAAPGDAVGGDTLDLLFTIEVVPTDALVNTVGTQEVRIGKEHIVKSQHLEFEYGVVMTCEWSE